VLLVKLSIFSNGALFKNLRAAKPLGSWWKGIVSAISQWSKVCAIVIRQAEKPLNGCRHSGTKTGKERELSFESQMKQTLRKIRLALQQLSYRQVRNRLAFEKPMDAVLTGADSETAFDAKGKSDAEWLISIIGNDQRVLDVGCGMGRIEKFLAPHCRELHAIDVSPVMIGLLKHA
jgi:2-polyprenyl-3-methyl-5-hydroxy-6-metoxy-1,4-benzoquinol methylase